MRCLLLSGPDAPRPAGGVRIRLDAWDVPEGDVSLPRTMAGELLSLRAEHASWAFSAGLALAGALKGGSGLSMWWCSTLYERHPKVTPALHDVYLLRSLERLLVRLGATSVEARGLSERQAAALRTLCSARGWAFEASGTSRGAPKGTVRRLYDACPAPVRACVRLVHWLWTVKRLLPKADLPPAGGETGTVVTYFPNISAEDADRGVFRSRYWESLHDALADDAGPPAVRWVFVRFPSPQGSLAECVAWKRKFEESRKSGVSFRYLEEFLGPGDLAAAFLRYVRIAASSLLRQAAAKEAFRLEGSGLSLWPLLGPEWAESFRGWRCLERCIQQRGLENCVAAAGAQRWHLFPMENCPWERMLSSAVRAAGAGPVMGAQHSTVRPTDFRYFDDPRTWTHAETRDFQPDLVVANGESAASQWRAAGVPPERLGSAEALRYLYLAKLKAEGAGRPWTSRILVVTSFFADETEAHLELLAACLKEGVLDPESVTVKPHPYLPVDGILRRLLGEEASRLRISTAPMPEELKERPVVWASNSTTAVLEAAIMGLPVLVMRPRGDFDLCPLQDLPGLPRTSDVASAREALARPAPLAVPEDYLRLDPDLPEWRRLLGLGRNAGAR